MAKKRKGTFIRDRLGVDMNPQPTSFEPAKNRSIYNVYDDKAWGPNWGPDRRAAEAKLKAVRAKEGAKAAENQEANTRRDQQRQERIENNPGGPYSWARFSTSGVRYHITPDGRAKPCQASTRACPYGTTDHFGLEPSARLDPQRVANWIVERRNNATATTTHVDLEAGDSDLDMRSIARQVREEAKSRGARANIIELEATLTLPRTKYPVRLSRKIGNTIDNRWADHAYWVLDDGEEEHVLTTDHITEQSLSDFVARYLEKAALLETPARRTEIGEELKYQLRHIMRVSEGEAALAQEGSAHYSTAQLSLQDEFKLDGNRVSGRVNYSTSGFDPSHLKAIGAVASPAITHVEVAQGFEVFDPDAGEGTAAWRLVKTDEGWSLTVQGTRGDVAQFPVASPEEGAQLFKRLFQARVRQPDPRKGRFFDDAMVPATPTQAVEEREDFIRQLLSTQRSSSAEEQGELFSMAPGEDATAHESVTRVLGLME